MYIYAVHIYLVPVDARRGQSNPLELDLHMAVSCHETASHWLQVL